MRPLSTPGLSSGLDYDGCLRWLRKSPYNMVDLFLGPIGRTPSEQQRGALDVLDHEHRIPYHARKKRISLCAGQGVGKTSLLTWVLGWRTVRRFNNLSVLTAPTGRQARDVFIAEMRVGIATGDPILREMFKCYHDHIKIFDQTAWTIKTATTTREEDLAGWHRDGLTTAIDEASGVGLHILETFLGTLTNEDSYLLLTGNPNKRGENPLYQSMKGSARHLYHRFVWSTVDCPFADRARDERLIEEYGWDSDVVRVRVRGLFPRGNPNAVLIPEHVESSMSRFQFAEFAERTPLPGYTHQAQVGLDFSFFGSDESVIAVRVNRKVRIFPHMNIDPDDLVKEAEKEVRKLGLFPNEVQWVGDAGSFGGPAMRRLSHKYDNVHQFHNGGKPSLRDYKNRITEGWFSLRFLLKDQSVVIEDNDLLRQQLLSRTYSIDETSGQIVLTKKKDEVKDGSPSPDRAEAVIYACYDKAQCRPLSGFFRTNYGGPDELFVSNNERTAS